MQLCNQCYDRVQGSARLLIEDLGFGVASGATFGALQPIWGKTVLVV